MAEACFRHQPASHTLQPTALVHEAFLKLVDRDAVEYADRGHFLAVAATAMRQILIDHARTRGAAKRGGDRRRVALEDAPVNGAGADQLDLLALDEALTRLAALDGRQARVVELRFFGGLSVKETGEALGVSPRTVELDWRMAKAWLSRALSEAGGP